jgi:rhodanese-related sulfurtransferase
VGEEKRFNPRLGVSRSLDDFTRIMSELQLPFPRKMDVAVPANLACGLPGATSSPLPADLDWAPLTLSASGVPELAADWVAQNSARVSLIDVREPDEFHGPIGHIPSSELVPLARLAGHVQGLPRERPMVTVCRSGGRSGKAALQLSALGFSRVASLRGGMLDWTARKLAIEYGRPPERVDRQG